jgi:glyoxylase-like metal-dependent hydrolase (beta-lactamase superfamily II)
MRIKKITDDVYMIPMGFVNAFFIVQDGLTLIDTGIPGNGNRIMAAAREVSARRGARALHGEGQGEIRQILLTHLHFDHTGSLAEVKRSCGAPATMHAADAAMVRQGISMRAVLPPPGAVSKLLFSFIGGQSSRGEKKEGIDIEHEFQEECILPAAGGIRAIPTPGHTVGHAAFLWDKHGGVLFAGDVFMHFLRVGHPPLYENYALAQSSLNRISELEYDAICFAHGRAIVGRAAERMHERIKRLAHELEGLSLV